MLHGEQVKRQFEIAWKEAKTCKDRLAVSASTRGGVYLQLKGKAGYDLLTKSLEDTRQGVRLHNVQTDEAGIICATVFIPNKKQDYFIKKIFVKIPFDMTAKEDKTRTCYMQACLAYVNFEAINNTDIRRIFGLSDKEMTKASRIIKDKVDTKLIKALDPNTAPQYMKYIPYWA